MRALASFTAALALLAVLLSACERREAPRAAEPRPVRVAAVGEQALHPVVTASGFVEAWSVRRLGLAAEGRLAGRAEVGHRFDAGAPLAKIDDTHHRLGVERAEAALQVAAAVLREVEAGARPEELQRAEQQQAEVRARLDQAQADLARADDLRRRGTSSQFEYDQAATQRNVIAAQLLQAEAALRLLREGASAEQRALARSRVREAESEVARARARLDDLVLAAPVAGIVSETYAEPGEQVAAGQPVVLIQEDARMKVTIGLPDTEVGLVREGLAASVRIDGFPGRRFRGRVHRVAPASRGVTRSFPVEVEIDDPDRAGLKPGMFAWIEIRTGAPVPRLTVPADAVVVRPDGRRVVFAVARDGSGASDAAAVALEREVEVDRVREGALVVTRGLERGDLIVVAGQADLVSGDRVRLLAPAAEPGAEPAAEAAGAAEAAAAEPAAEAARAGAATSSPPAPAPAPAPPARAAAPERE